MIKSLSTQRLIDELEYWSIIGIASDIYEIRGHRPEYQPYVDEALRLKLYEHAIVEHVLFKLRLELIKPWYRKTLWIHLIKGKVSKILRL